MIQRLAAFLLLSLAAGCSRRPHPRQMELWLWSNSYVPAAGQVEVMKARIDRAAKAGYTGIALWDSSWTFLSMPGWPQSNVDKLKDVVRYAAARGLKVMPTVAPYGHSNDLLKIHPDWAEGQRINGARFRVEPDGRSLRLIKSLEEHPDLPPQPLVTVKLRVTPWRQYHVRLLLRTQGFHGAAQLEISDGPANRLDANLHPPPDQDWRPLDYTFNSAESTHLRLVCGLFGPPSNQLLVKDLTVEETALVYVLRREGTPLRLYDPDLPGHVYTEGHDFNPVHDRKLLAKPEFAADNYHDPGPVTLPPATTLRPGQTVAMDYYAVVPVYDEAVSVCLTDKAVTQWMLSNARADAALLPPQSPLLLSHDEIRQMNSCAQCRAQHKTAGELLARHITQLSAQLHGMGELYIWSDMFDPHHNAIDHLFAVEGTVARSWKGLTPEIAVMNWNLPHLRESLLWFSGDHPQQRVPYKQIIAGYYDPPEKNGALAAHTEWQEARGIPGVAGMMYTTWTGDYSQMETFAQTAKQEWARYRDSRPW